MVSMTLDPSSALAEKYKGNRQILEQAVLGRGGDAGIDPYSALRALQKLNVADKYEQMQQAMQGQVNPPSVAQQTLAQAARAQAPMMAPPSPAPQAPQSGGLAAMPVPEETFGMAGGGIVAFAQGGLGDITYPDLSPEEIAYGEKYRAGYEQELKPEEYYASRTKQIEDMQSMGPEDLEQEKGLAALQAASAMLQGNNVMRGLGAAGAVFGQHYGEALRAAKKEKRSLMQMQIELEDARRKEQAGLYEKQKAAEDRALQHKIDAAKFNLDQQKALETVNAEKARTAATVAAAKVSAESKTPNPEYTKMQWFLQDEQRKWMLANPGKQPTDADIIQLQANAAERAKNIPYQEKALEQKTEAANAELMRKAQEQAKQESVRWGLLSPKELNQRLDERAKELYHSYKQQSAPATGTSLKGLATLPTNFVED